jgi:hypothetical protein
MCVICETDGILYPYKYLSSFQCCGCVYLTHLPEILPEGLDSLSCNDCPKLTHLPEDLPKDVYGIRCGNCINLTRLPEHLPEGLLWLYCNGCPKLTELPEHLPEGLEKLYCNDCTNLTRLPDLPKSLKILDCSGCTGLIFLPKHNCVEDISKELKEQIERNYEAYRKKMCKQQVDTILEELIKVTWEPQRASQWCWDNEEKEFLGFL